MKISWQTSEYAGPYFAAERTFLQQGLRQAIGPSVLQIGDMLDAQVVDELDLPQVVRSRCEWIDDGQSQFDQKGDLVADPAFLPFDVDTFSTVLLPHVIEIHDLPHQVLREALRVLQPDGHILLTGFNPLSLLGMQRLLSKNAAPPGRYYTVRRVVDWLQLLGFEVTASSIFHYAPLSKRDRVRRSLAFLEPVGNRWLPMTGGAYMICAKKRVAGNTFIGKPILKRAKPKLVAATARHSKSSK